MQQVGFMHIELHLFWPCSNLELGLYRINETMVTKTSVKITNDFFNMPIYIILV